MCKLSECLLNPVFMTEMFAVFIFRICATWPALFKAAFSNIWFDRVHLIKTGHSPNAHNFEIVQVDFLAGEINVNVHVEVQREELGAEAPRRTKPHKVSFVVVVEQLE